MKKLWLNEVQVRQLGKVKVTVKKKVLTWQLVHLTLGSENGNAMPKFGKHQDVTTFKKRVNAFLKGEWLLAMDYKNISKLNFIPWVGA